MLTTDAVAREDRMSPDAFEAACLALPGTHKVVQWGGSDVYKVGPKVFAIASRFEAGQPVGFIFKVSDLAYELLIEHGVAGRAPYLGRAKWVKLTGHDALDDGDLAAYLREAHAIVAAKLTRAQRKDLGLPERMRG